MKKVWLFLEKKLQPAAKGRLDQRLCIRLLHLGEYVEVLVEAPRRQNTNHELLHGKLYLWEAVEGNANLDFSCQGGNYISWKILISLHRWAAT